MRVGDSSERQRLKETCLKGGSGLPRVEGAPQGVCGVCEEVGDEHERGAARQAQRLARPSVHVHRRRLRVKRDISVPQQDINAA
jgi:hypothetical protein